LIYICIPTHNEQQTVGVVLWKLRQVLTEYPRDYQLLVADDASTDKTQEVLEPYTRVLPLTVIRSDAQLGYAASLELLLREASRRSEYPRRDIVVTLQADFSEEPDDLVSLLKRMEAGADVAVGTKAARAKQPLLRKIARRLSGFFVRGQQWPEGVPTPFDGYRAYRMHAVNRAMEERGGRRLLRYDGWACSAELLRAVLPHARRVDVVEVEDRTDRMQRPSRERPMAAAMQVRAAMREADPEGLVSVEELDRLAATAARARERTILGNGNGSRAQQAATRQGRTRDRRPEGRPRGDGREREGTSDRDRRPGREGSRSRAAGSAGSAGSDGAETRRDRGRGEGRAEAGAEGRSPQQGGRRPRQEGEAGPRQESRRSRQPRGGARTEAAAAADGTVSDAPSAGASSPGEGVSQAEREALELLTGAPLGAERAEGAEGAEGGEAQPGEGGPKKRRRRRRGRGGAKALADGAEGGPDDGAAGGAPEGDAGDQTSGEGSGEAGEAGEGEAKRRRRGGRRGGRGRRRRGADGENGSEGNEGNEGGEDGAGPGDARAEAGQQETGPPSPGTAGGSAPAQAARSSQE
jgi:hypothetical protein